MRLVTRRTGLTAHLIRAWERRHNAVTPVRTATNRRLYTDEDICRLILLRDATSGGHSIGQIAQLPFEELERLAAETAPNLSPAPTSAGPHVQADTFLEEAMVSLAGFDAERLENVLSRAAISLSQGEWMEAVVVPLLHRIGDRWQEGTIGVASEHLGSAVVRTLLGNMNEEIRREDSAPRLLVTTPAGQRHELGALLATITAATGGWNATYLGPDLPAADIASVMQLRRARTLGLSLVYPEDDPALPGELREIRRRLPRGATILVGGRAAPSYQEVLDEIGAVSLEDLDSLREALARKRRN